jgi:hypothetical protein
MKTSSFHIVPLPTEIAEAARRVVNAGAADHALVTVDAPGSATCRHCLRWARPGERVILFPYAAIPSGHRILRQARSLFTPTSAGATAPLTNTPPIFAMVACFGPTIQITTSSTRKL